MHPLVRVACSNLSAQTLLLAAHITGARAASYWSPGYIDEGRSSMIFTVSTWCSVLPVSLCAMIVALIIFATDGCYIIFLSSILLLGNLDRNANAFDDASQGDNNYGDDKVLYAQGQEWLNKKHVMGRAIG
eukprot:629433-Pyramimonas_sp.AAC.1